MAGDSLDGLTFDGLQGALRTAGVNAIHAKPLFNRLHRKLIEGNLTVEHDLPPPLLRWLC